MPNPRNPYSATRFCLLLGVAADEIDILCFDGDNIVVESWQLSGEREDLVLEYSVNDVMGGRFINLGPDGLVRFYVNTPYLPNGDVAESFDGWPHHYVYDRSARRLFRLDSELEAAVFLERPDGESAH